MTTMRTITAAEFLAMTDIFAKAIEYQLAAIGDEDTVASAVGQAALVRDYIVAFADPDEAEITADLIDSAIEVVAALQRTSGIQGYYATFNSAVYAHLSPTQLNAWLTSEAAGRVHPLFKKWANPTITPANTFPPATILGAVALTGSTAGTLTATSGVDTTLYGGARIEVEVINQAIGAGNDVTFSLTCTLEGGTTATKTGTITKGSLVGAKVTLGSASDLVVAVTAVTITNGNNGDDFQINTIPERSI